MSDTAALRDKLIAGQNEATKGYKKFTQAQFYGTTHTRDLNSVRRQLDEGTIFRCLKAFCWRPLSLKGYPESTPEHRDPPEPPRRHRALQVPARCGASPLALLRHAAHAASRYALQGELGDQGWRTWSIGE